MSDSTALHRAKTLRGSVNSVTGYDDDTITRGVQRLLTMGGDERAVPHEASTLLSIYPDPGVSKEEFGRLKDYGDFNYFELYEEYRQLEYVEAFGYSFINTGLLSSEFDEVNAELELNTISIGSGLFSGSSSSSAASTKSKCLILVENANRFYTNMGINNNWSAGSSYYYPQTDTRYQIYCKMLSGTQIFAVNGETKISSSYSVETTSTYPVWFLNINYAGNSMVGTGSNQQRGFNGRIYSSSWSLNSIIKRNYIPYNYEIYYKETDELCYEEAGFLDILENKFYSSIGPEKFSKGPYAT